MHQLEIGEAIGVYVKGIDKQCTGTISEIVPESESASRASSGQGHRALSRGHLQRHVRRIAIPLEDEEVLVIPRSAVRRVGQLELVDVVEQGRTMRRAIRTGRVFDEDCRGLDPGLHSGEQVTLPEPSVSPREGNNG